VQGVVKLPQALIRDKRVETLFLLPASQTRDKDALTEEGVGRVIAELRTILDWVICDSPAGAHWGRSAGPAGFESKRKMLGKRTPLR
jgi:septum site-determining protein MinD